MPGLNDPELKKTALETADPRAEREQERLETEEAEIVVVTPAIEPVPEVSPDAELEAMSVKQLQEVITRLGFLGSENFVTKKQCIAVIHNLKARPSYAPPSVTQKIETPTEKKSWEGKRERTKKIIDAKPKVRTMIPLDIGEKPGAFIEPQINGYKLRIPKGVYVNIPEPFAELIAYCYNQTAAAGSDISLDRPGVGEETGKTVAEVLA